MGMPENPEKNTGILYVVATPIGNLEDITLRALRIMCEVDTVACEDTRRTRIIFEKHKIPYKNRVSFISYREGEEEEKRGKFILSLLKQGKDVILCSDSGTPGISDPGYRIIRMCIKENLPVSIIPGPSAVITAVVLSGLPTSSFLFLGFLPKKEKSLSQLFEEIKGYNHTIVFFESPYRILKSLRLALGILGDREAAVCFEMTKMFERVERGYISDICGRISNNKNIKGEVTAVISPCNPKFFR